MRACAMSHCILVFEFFQNKTQKSGQSDGNNNMSKNKHHLRTTLSAVSKSERRAVGEKNNCSTVVASCVQTMEADGATRANHPTSDRRRASTKPDGFLPIGQGHGKRQKSLRRSTRFLVLILGLVIVLRLLIENSLVRNHLFSTRNEQTPYGSEESSLHPRNQTFVLPSSPCNDVDEFPLGNTNSKSTDFRSRTFTNHPITICSGSTFQNVPSAINLILPSRTQKGGKSCYETCSSDAFRDKSNRGHDYSDANYVIHVLGGGKCNQDGFESLPRDASNNVVVTAYYEIPSKHPPSQYHDWMRNFLTVYKDPLVIFTSPDLVELLANLRRRNGTELCDHPPCGPIFLDTIIVALPLEDLPLAKLYPKSFWVDQLDRDPQSNIHSPLRGDPRMQGKFESGELYWIWLSKIWFVVEATRVLGVNITSEYWNDSSRSLGEYSDNLSRNSKYDDKVFAWIDIGSFRNEDPTAKNQSNPPMLIRHPEVVPDLEVLFWSHSSAHSSKSSESKKKIVSDKNYTPIPPRQSPYFDDKKLGGGKHFFHSGAHFAGRPRSILRFYHQFLQTIDAFVKRNLTLADDQAVLQSSCLSFSYEHCGEHDGCEDNLCAYATRDMVGGKSKWFGLTKLLQTGWKETNQRTRAANRSGGDPKDLYWRPPPPTYYLDYTDHSIWSPPNCSSVRD